MSRPLCREGVEVCSRVRSKRAVARWGTSIDSSAGVGPCHELGIASPVRRCGGDDVGCKVSAFRSQCSTEILCVCSAGMRSGGGGFEEKVRFGCRAGQVNR
jgi:hypothetical protein